MIRIYGGMNAHVADDELFTHPDLINPDSGKLVEERVPQAASMHGKRVAQATAQWTVNRVTGRRVKISTDDYRQRRVRVQLLHYRCHLDALLAAHIALFAPMIHAEKNLSNQVWPQPQVHQLDFRRHQTEDEPERPDERSATPPGALKSQQRQ
jgi:hypothetical protein